MQLNWSESESESEHGQEQEQEQEQEHEHEHEHGQEHRHRARDRVGSLLRRASHAGLPIGGRDFDRLEEIVEMSETMF